MKNKKAFTLIELMLALSLFSLIALSLYSTFSAGINLNKRSEKVDRVYREMRWTLQKITKEMESMAYYDFSTSYPELMPCAGDSKSFRFLLPTREGLKFVQYELKAIDFGSVYTTIVNEHHDGNVPIDIINQEQTNPPYAFVRRQADFVDYLSTESFEDSEESILSSKIVAGGLKFSYGYIEQEGEEVKVVWKDKWELTHIPSRMKVELTFINPRDPQNVYKVKRNILIPPGQFGQEEEEK